MIFAAKSRRVDAVYWTGTRFQDGVIDTRETVSDLPDFIKQGIGAFPGDVGAIVQVGNTVTVWDTDGYTTIALPGSWLVRLPNEITVVMDNAFFQNFFELPTSGVGAGLKEEMAVTKRK